MDIKNHHNDEESLGRRFSHPPLHDGFSAAKDSDYYPFSSFPPTEQHYLPTGSHGETLYEPADPYQYESEAEDDELTRRTRAVLEGNGFARNPTVTGGRAAAAKRITADLDMTDQIISRMKIEGYRDADIRDHLVRLGLESYNEKTISTRNIRIRRVILAKETTLLDEAEHDWAQIDDQHLIGAVDALAEGHKKEVQALKTKHWVEIAQKKKELDQDAKHSSHSCQRRYEALIDGTARIPYDIDPEKEARMTEIKTQAETVKRRRKLRAKAVKQAEEHAMQQVQNRADREREAEDRKHNRLAASARRRQEREQAKANREREEQARQLEAARRETEKQERDRARLEDSARRRRDAEMDRKNRQHLREEEKTRRQQEKLKEDIEKKQAVLREQQQKLVQAQDKQISAEVMKNFARNLVEDITKKSEKERQQAAKARSAAANALNASNSDAVAQDPRISLKLHQLRDLCRKRNLSIAGTSVDLVATLRKHDSDRKVSELQEELVSHGAHKTGSKAQLVHRLATIDAGLYVHPTSRVDKVTPTKRKSKYIEANPGDDDDEQLLAEDDDEQPLNKKRSCSA